MNKTVFFDLETGGTDPEKHPIIQIAAMAVDENWLVLESCEVKIKFDEEACSEEALKVNSFDPEVWAEEAVGEREALRFFSRFLKRHATVKMISKRGRPYYVAQMAGHNAATFDGPFLQAWYRRLDEFLPGYFRVLCTCQLAQWFFYNKKDQPENMKLETLCKFFDIEIEGAHDAMVDIQANVELARVLFTEARDE